eukprot:symbB.v1.2.022051.t1/scaffold1928.1/size95828/9
MDKDQRTPLVAAAMLGHDEIVTILLSAGARLDSTPALHAAAKGAFHEVVRLLLEARADVNDVHDGSTPLDALLANSNDRSHFSRAKSDGSTTLSLLVDAGATSAIGEVDT